MKQLLLGILLGIMISGAFAYAGSGSPLYKKDGSLNAPRGSQQEFDYLRQRQQYLDLNAMRRQSDQDRVERLTNPCGK